MKAVFTIGIPGAGKSTWIDENDIRNKYHVVSADQIKKTLKGYDDKKPHLVHDESVALAEKLMYDIAADEVDIFMDGGGINNRYTLRIINKLKVLGYEIEILYFNTPLEVCLERNKKRDRVVPEDDIIKKFFKLPNSLYQLRLVADVFTEINYYTNKHLFFDMDGVLASYQIIRRDVDGNVDFVNNGVFEFAPPVKPVINKLLTDSKNSDIYIVSAAANTICQEEKLKWIDKYLPLIKKENIYFVGNKEYKYLFLKQLITKLKLDTRDCTLIDDYHKTLEKCLTVGIRAIHPSLYLSE